MKRIASITLAAALAAALAAGSRGAAQAPILSRVIASSSSVKSYTSSVHAEVQLRTFPYLSAGLDGTFYHKEPSKTKILFTSGVPVIAQQFDKLYPDFPSPAEWDKAFVITSEGDAGGYTTLQLVPRKTSRVDHYDAKIDDKTADVSSLHWTYTDGGSAWLDQTYANIQGHRLPVAQNGHVEIPHWKADWKLTHSDFKLNADIPDSVFTQ